MEAPTTSWSGSWADDDEDDLPPPPPPAPKSPTERKSYAQIAVIPAPEPIILQEERPQLHAEDFNAIFIQAPRKKKLAPVRTIRAVSAYQATIEFAVVRDSKPHIHIRRSTPVIVTQEVKCDKCHEERGYLKFTERHVEAQSKSAPEHLQVGVYCLRCVTSVSPRCSKTQCEGKAIICSPEATYPFGLFCSSCISAHRATLRS